MRISRRLFCFKIDSKLYVAKTLSALSDACQVLAVLVGLGSFNLPIVLGDPLFLETPYFKHDTMPMSSILECSILIYLKCMTNKAVQYWASFQDLGVRYSVPADCGTQWEGCPYWGLQCNWKNCEANWEACGAPASRIQSGQHSSRDVAISVSWFSNPNCGQRNADSYSHSPIKTLAGAG